MQQPNIAPDDELEQQYDNLTEKQRAVIDAHAQNPDETNREKARIAGEDILGTEPVNESYCSEIINSKYPELAKYREEIEQNERPEGKQKTIGDPFANLQDEDQSYQTITDRPVKETEASNSEQEPQEHVTMQEPQQVRQQFESPAVQIADAGDGIHIKLSYRYVQELLESPNSQLPDDLHQQLVDVVLKRAFN